MRQIIIAILLFSSLPVSAQKIKELKPILGYLVDKSPEKEIEFINNIPKCIEIWAKLDSGIAKDSLTKEETKILDDCSDTETKESSWDILGIGCSWYCGGGQDTNSASSNLQPSKGIKYAPNNIHDLSYETAW